MKRLFFSELLLLSHLEKRGMKVSFDPKITVIVGKNDTGKSSLIKSLFRPFGAEPRQHPRWKTAKVIELLKFRIDDVNYSMLHHGGSYSLFDSKDNLVKSFKSVTKDLAPYLANMFELKLKLPNKANEPITPPPAYFFLPFYIDQDKSWSNNWCAFENLGQLSNWRTKLVEYHTGIRPNSYYDLLAQTEDLSGKLTKTMSEIKVQSGVLRKFDEKFKVADFSMDINVFKMEIEELLLACEKLKNKEEELKEKLNKYNNIRIHVETQISVVENAIKEINKDFDFATDDLLSEDVECPTCGAIYENSFSERFHIAQDENRCQELLIQLKEELLDVNSKIDKTKTEFNSSLAEMGKIREILDKKQSEIRLQEIIESQGKKEVRGILKQEINIQYEEAHKFETDIEKWRKELKHFDKADKRKTILDKYLDYMNSNLHDLAVHNLDEKSFKRIDAKIKESGSDLPRALLAYYYSILHLMGEFSSSAYCPIVIDSPNQQDQDKDSLRKMVKFIISNRPQNSQLILATATLEKNVKFEGRTIELETKDHLLSEGDYKKVVEEMSPYFSRSLFAVRG